MILRLIVVTCCLVSSSCAVSSVAPERMRPIAGIWRTEQDIIVEVGADGDGGYTATIVSAPGFLSGNNSPGSVVMTGIRAQADGSFTARFLVPGTEPVSVRIGLAYPDGLVIVTRDSRRRGGTMIWHRVTDQ